MAPTVLASMNQSDLVIIEKQLSVAASDDGGGGGGVNGTAGIGSAGDNSTSPSPTIWISYNSSATNTIENTNASRHLAEHAETSGAVGIEAVIIVAVVSLIPVSVIACMVFVISFNCLKKKNSLWSTSASPGMFENNAATSRERTQMTSGSQRRRKSAARSILENENIADAHLHRFNGENGCNNDRIAIATIDTYTYTPTSTCAPTPSSLIYPMDAFSAYLDASKSSLTTATTPISNNSVITMTMRNNHLIVETEERIPCCSLLNGQNFYACSYRGGGGGGGSSSDDGDQIVSAATRYHLNNYHEHDRDFGVDDDDDDGDGDLFDETSSIYQNRSCQRAKYAVDDQGCALCVGGGGGGGGGGHNDDDDDDDDNYDGNREFTGGSSATAFYTYGASDVATAILASNGATTRPEEEDEEGDQRVQIFHKNLPVVATGFSQLTIPSPLSPNQQQQSQSRKSNNESGASCDYKYGEDDDDDNNNSNNKPLEIESPTSPNSSRGGIDATRGDAETDSTSGVGVVPVDARYSQGDSSADRSEHVSRDQSPLDLRERFVTSAPLPCDDGIANKPNGVAVIENDDNDHDNKSTFHRAVLDSENGCDWTRIREPDCDCDRDRDSDTKSQSSAGETRSSALTSVHSPPHSRVHRSHT